MWNETKQGLYKKFVFTDFHAAWIFMERVRGLFSRENHYPRWRNEANVVEIWLSTNEGTGMIITNSDKQISQEIDAIAADGEQATVEAIDEKNTTKITEVNLYADGGSRGNPGPSASGFVVLNVDGEVLYQDGAYLGITTNNQAEYQALKLGLEYVLHTFGARKVHVYMDSLLVINQMKKIFKVRNRDLWPVHDAILTLLGKFESVSFDHVPRELNRLADAEVNKCLDAQQGE